MDKCKEEEKGVAIEQCQEGEEKEKKEGVQRKIA